MNDNNIKILVRFLLFLAVLGCVCLYGITNTYALETKTIYSTNSSGTLGGQNTYTYGYLNQGGVQNTSTASVNTNINNRALALIYYMYEPVVLNKTYTMVVNFYGNDLINTFTSNMVQVATCNGEVCNDNAIVSVVKNNPNGYSNKLTIEFNPVTSGSILLVNLSDKSATRYITGAYNNQYFGIKSVTLDSVNANQDIINNQTNNTNNIINNNNSNTQEIINNQNQNTQQQIDSQMVCTDFGINNITGPDCYLNSAGQTGYSSSYKCTDFIKILGAKIKVLYDRPSSSDAYYACFYDDEKTKISCIKINTLSEGQELNIPTNAVYFRSSIGKSDEKPLYSICKNGNQAISDNLNNLNDSLTDSSPVDMSSLGDVAGWLPAGPIDSIINLPLTFMNNLYTALSGTCSSLHIPIPYLQNKFIDIPCISTIYQQINGFDTFWNWVGGICSVLILYKYLIALYKYYDDLTTLKANFISDFGGAP